MCFIPVSVPFIFIETRSCQTRRPLACFHLIKYYENHSVSSHGDPPHGFQSSLADYFMCILHFYLNSPLSILCCFVICTFSPHSANHPAANILLHASQGFGKHSYRMHSLRWTSVSNFDGHCQIDSKTTFSVTLVPLAFTSFPTLT